MSGNDPNGESTTYIQNIEKYKKENPKLTVADIQTYNINRANYFSGTIAVCVIYGVFSLILLLITVFSPSGSELVTDIFRTFTVTFIIGMIIAVILLTISVVTYRPSVLAVNPYDAQVCPDYWQLVQSTDAEKGSVTALNKSLMQYKCVNNNKLGKNLDTVRPSTSQKPLSGTSDDPIEAKILYNYKTDKPATAATTYSDANTIDCTKVFPLLLNSVNTTNSEINSVPNALACKYADQCGVSWSAMCPNGATYVPS